ncbi:MAG: DNA-processing protein DprA [Clostridia bacterium]
MFKIKQKVCLLLSTLGFGTPLKRYQLLNLFGGAEELFMNIESHSQEIIDLIGQTAYVRLKYSANEAFCDSLYLDLLSKGIIPVTYYCSNYPKLFKQMPDPPLAIYCKGNLDLLNSACFAVVGTRKASPYGKKVASIYVAELAKRYTIVSGLAYGIDTVAHQTTLNCLGKTVAVLGSGLLNVYPVENQALSQSIVDNGGLLISEYQAYDSPNQYNFPMRNRLISGLSKGILIVEAPLKSGVMSTYEYALEQGKDIYVVPGDIFDTNFKGSNQILKSLQGAMTLSPQDILNCDLSVAIPKPPIQLNMEEQIVVDELIQGKLHFDDIVNRTKLKSSTLNFILANLELKGIICKLVGNFYQYLNTEE